ncbi:MAG: hypothetical protein LBV73_22575 [Paraburkholderia sp.]|nr:hypothetical protein [Paraburkholderia sp.]
MLSTVLHALRQDLRNSENGKKADAKADYRQAPCAANVRGKKKKRRGKDNRKKKHARQTKMDAQIKSAVGLTSNSASLSGHFVPQLSPRSPPANSVHQN